MSIAATRPEAVIDLIDSSQAPLLARPYYQDSDPGPIVAALAHVPEVLDSAMPFLAAMYGPSALPARLKEVVVVRTSAHHECRYCIESHSVVALDAGLSRLEILGLRDLVGPALQRWSKNGTREGARGMGRRGRRSYWRGAGRHRTWLARVVLRRRDR